jgi:C4-dicarboxylate-specific signal transduction histidine kinase
MQAREKEFYRKDGSRVPVLIGAAAFEGQPNQGVAYILDLTARKRAEAEARESERRYREVQMELAHANRVATMGQLTGSIAHEVSQPISATVTNAQAALLWLERDPPDLEEVRDTLARIIQDGKRAGDVVSRIRDLIKKAPPRQDLLDINDPIQEVIALTRSEAVKNQVSVKTELASGLPLIRGDRVQLKQLMLNLIVNAIEAMGGAETRELVVGTRRHSADEVLVTVQDTGPGLPSAGGRMGLSICRSIVEAHNGRLWAGASGSGGAKFEFALPAKERTL